MRYRKPWNLSFAGIRTAKTFRKLFDDPFCLLVISMATGNKYLDNASEATSDDEDECNIFQIARTGTYVEMKDAISLDRPRLIALKDEVSLSA
jgi:hypothetical protein